MMRIKYIPRPPVVIRSLQLEWIDLVKSEPDDDNFIVILKCSCGYIGPANYSGVYSHPKLKEAFQITACPECDIVPYDETSIVGYASFEALKQMGWDSDE